MADKGKLPVRGGRTTTHNKTKKKPVKKAYKPMKKRAKK